MKLPIDSICKKEVEYSVGLRRMERKFYQIGKFFHHLNLAQTFFEKLRIFAEFNMHMYNNYLL